MLADDGRGETGRVWSLEEEEGEARESRDSAQPPAHPPAAHLGGRSTGVQHLPGVLAGRKKERRASQKGLVETAAIGVRHDISRLHQSQRGRDVDDRQSSDEQPKAASTSLGNPLGVRSLPALHHWREVQRQQVQHCPDRKSAAQPYLHSAETLDRTRISYPFLGLGQPSRPLHWICESKYGALVNASSSRWRSFFLSIHVCRVQHNAVACPGPMTRRSHYLHVLLPRATLIWQGAVCLSATKE